VDLDVSGAARVSASSATATALTTTGRIGVNTAAPTADLDVNGEGNILTGLTIGSSSNSSVVANSISSKLAIYHATDARIFLRHGTSDGLLIGNQSSSSFISHRPASGEFSLNCEQNVPMKFNTHTSSGASARMTILGDGKVGIGTTSPAAPLDVAGNTILRNSVRIGSSAAPTVALDVTGTANISSNLDVTGTSRFRAKTIQQVDLWQETSDGLERIHYGNGGTTYFKSGNGYVWKKSDNSDIMTLTTSGRLGIGTASPSVALEVNGSAAISGSMTIGTMTISGCKPRIAVILQSSPGINVVFDIPPALRSGGFIANKVYFAIRVPALSSTPALYLRPNGSATVFHSFTQQFTGSAPVFAGDSPTQGFRICNILNNTAFGGGIYVAPSYINIVGEFTIITDKVYINSTTSNPPHTTTRLYGTLVQYGNHYIQKWDFQGQAVGGGNWDIFNEITDFYFTSSTTYSSDTSVSVKIEGD
jgi:hypothetical protein